MTERDLNGLQVGAETLTCVFVFLPRCSEQRHFPGGTEPLIRSNERGWMHFSVITSKYWVWHKLCRQIYVGVLTIQHASSADCLVHHKRRKPCIFFNAQCSVHCLQAVFCVWHYPPKPNHLITRFRRQAISSGPH